MRKLKKSTNKSIKCTRGAYDCSFVCLNRNDLLVRISEAENQSKRNKKTIEEIEKTIQSSNQVQRTKEEEAAATKKSISMVEIEINESEKLNAVCIQENIIRQHVSEMAPSADINMLPSEMEKYSQLEGKDAQFLEDAKSFLALYNAYLEQMKKFHTKTECERSVLRLKELKEEEERLKQAQFSTEEEIKGISREKARLLVHSAQTKEFLTIS